MKIVKSITNCYNKMSNFGKVLLFVALLLVIVVFFRSLMPVREGLINNKTFLFKEGNAIYDDFYADIYDYLVFNQLKNDYEVGVIINNTTRYTKVYAISVNEHFYEVSWELEW